MMMVNILQPTVSATETSILTYIIIIIFLKKTFDDELMPQNVPAKWPPRSCHLTPLDYFHLEYAKLHAYVDKLETKNVRKMNL